MASEPNEDGQEAKASGKRLLPVVVAVSLGLLAGGGAGAFAAGTLLPQPSAEKASAKGAEEHADGEEKAGAAAGESDSGDDTDGGAAAATYLMENLVVNPAGTGGTRFLMVSVAFGVKDAAVAEEMKTRDHEVRDALVAVLGGKNVAQLADVAARDSLKLELRSRVGGLFAPGGVKKVYFPQFVIQ